MAQNTWSKEYFKYDPATSHTERGKVLIENHNRKVDEIDLAMQYGDVRKLCRMLTITMGEDAGDGRMTNVVGSGVRLQKYYSAIRERISEASGSGNGSSARAEASRRVSSSPSKWSS